MIQPDINILGLQIHWYSVILGLSILAGYLLARHRAIAKGFKAHLFDNLVLVSLISGLVGARLFFVAGHWQFFSYSKISILYFWQGGLAFYGAIIGSFIGLAIFYIYQSFDLRRFADCAALGLALGQGIGRFGNFFNSEAYGRPTNLPWGTYISPENRIASFENSNYFHPTFFYESFILLVLFFVLLRLDKSYISAPGTVFGLYATVSGASRFFIEFLRVDALAAGPFMISQVFAGLMFIIGVSILFSLNGKSAKQTA